MPDGPSEEQRQTMISRAGEVRRRAYAPYSGFCVGACLVTSDGSFFDGVNVENASLGLTLCAERTAASSAVAAGATTFLAMAIASPGGAAPCGACRQFLAEFHPALPLFLVDSERPHAVQTHDLGQLLPAQFQWDGHPRE